jgi:hypothetical protein
MREFGSIKLASWLCEKNIKFVLRIKQGRYIQEQGKEFKRESECGLVPGIRANASKFYVNRIWYIEEYLLSSQKTFN